ncbi:MAG: S8 family serine peptidase [Candidatus Thiothrix putei]|uniref:Subtilase family protein n=2 Tax=Thiothrix TaxID=1030 RepID=A0A1H4DJZ0_9GAMM|nr:S8 family serine peptidase [Thiothrix caldifontis]WGZ96043.1 MAG: S8 family serine peptidase [Candidatus Thiothrix putei]SEA73034.1 Subtilase family protein [Thiothrix caldifontis]
MSTEKYIILRSREISSPTRGDMGTRGAGVNTFSRPPATIKLEEADLTKRERNDLRRDPRTRAIAMPMPLKLIAPVRRQATDTPPSPPLDTTATWGVKAVRAPESRFDGTGISVAVLDTGIDPHHPAFAGMALVQQNFTTEEPNDLNGHGTHCAGTIFGQDVNGTRIGIARNIERALIGKVLGEGGGTSATLAKAIQWALHEGAHVISMSVGIDFPGYVDWLVQQENMNVNPATSMALEEYRANVNLFTELARFVQAYSTFGQGAIIVAASGNESNRPKYEISVAPPAAGTGIIAVGALGESDKGLKIAEFSNNQADISAPGVDILSAEAGSDKLTSMDGTSMATPHAAGVAALWAQRQLEMTGRVESQSLMAQLIASGTYAALDPDSEEDDVGTGIVQAPLN